MTSTPAELDDEEARTWRAYACAARRLFAQIDRDMQRDAGLPISYWELLRHLAESPGAAMRMSDLAEATQSAPSRLTHAVTQLESSGLVERRQCTTDRRGSYAALTEKGLAAVVAAGDAATQSLRTHFLGSLSAADLARLRGISEAILAHLDGGTGCPSGQRLRAAGGQPAEVGPGV
ncbi:MAG TPA: MarR family transcriptional regulator [Candidatus Dormibacteraeota bacterium]